MGLTMHSINLRNLYHVAEHLLSKLCNAILCKSKYLATSIYNAVNIPLNSGILIRTYN